MDDFKDIPHSINELKYDKASKNEYVCWGILTPRDLLVSMLRDIDNGTFVPGKTCIIVMETVKENLPANAVRTCGPSFSAVAGEFSYALHRFMS